MSVCSSLGEQGEHQTYVCTLGKLDAPGESSDPPLTNRVPTLAFLGGLEDLPRDGEFPVAYVDVDLVLGQARNLERGCHEVLVCILMKVHPKASVRQCLGGNAW